MSAVKYTPGPWDHQRPTGAVKAYDGKLIATVFGDHPKCEEDDLQIANAALVAAAPELLEALQLLTDAMETPRSLKASIAWDRARAAIAKAEGRS